MKIKWVYLTILVLLNFKVAKASSPLVSPGISLKLAQSRAKQISDLNYDLYFSIPNTASAPIEGTAIISFDVRDLNHDIILDTQSVPGKGALQIQTFKINGADSNTLPENDHLIISRRLLKERTNEVSLHFIAGESGFHRRDEFLYTLFVPDNASKTFPCFDQPDLKGRYKLTLKVPKDWVAVSQGSIVREKGEGDFKTLEFSQSQPTSTYLFAFAAGLFQTIKRKVGGREITMYHRESDPEKIKRNVDAIFEIHGHALEWLEDYTGLSYPFDKFDFVLLPAFPFGGMEHPGSIFYRDTVLLLDGSATQDQFLQRADTISHETSHMWFGDLVTMKWFNDVWLKEVFANFMADKMVNPLFPKINHDIQFFLNHYPWAYNVDRTKGTNPIQQKLENLNAAGQLYGDIIYHKAPIVMMELEKLVGEENFKNGLRKYLKTFKFSNASWLDLIQILSGQSGKNLKKWSHTWIETPGRPTFKAKFPEKEVKNFWPQDYGLFLLDPASIEYLKENLCAIKDENLRAVAWVNLRENVYEHRLSPRDFITLGLKCLPQESQALIIDFVSGYVRSFFWPFLTPDERRELSPQLESFFWQKIESPDTPTLIKSTYFGAYQAVFTSDDGWDKINALWQGKTKILGLNLSEPDFMNMAYNLVLRRPAEYSKISKLESEKIKDPERKKEFEFIVPSAGGSDLERDELFARIQTDEGRKNEPWVRTSIFFLSHPLRGNKSVAYVAPSLELLPRIKETGGLFFPKDWLSATLQNHIDLKTRQIVETYLKTHPHLDPGLKLKLLQASDTLMRFTNQ